MMSNPPRLHDQLSTPQHTQRKEREREKGFLCCSMTLCVCVCAQHSQKPGGNNGSQPRTFWSLMVPPSPNIFLSLSMCVSSFCLLMRWLSNQALMMIRCLRDVLCWSWRSRKSRKKERQTNTPVIYHYAIGCKWWNFWVFSIVFSCELSDNRRRARLDPIEESLP
jgi:hypothetical protein